MNDTKKEYFQAFLIELLKWYKEEYPDREDNDLSKLKVLKLLFLGVSKDENSLSIFNNFMAWDLGPVEKEVYEAIKGDTLGFGTVDNNHFELTNSSVTSSEEAEEFASKVIEFLKHKNTNLIRLSASSLVDITHKWDCWIVARMFGNDTISKKLILSSKRYYS